MRNVTDGAYQKQVLYIDLGQEDPTARAFMVDGDMLSNSGNASQLNDQDVVLVQCPVDQIQKHRLLHARTFTNKNGEDELEVMQVTPEMPANIIAFYYDHRKSSGLVSDMKKFAQSKIKQATSHIANQANMKIAKIAAGVQSMAQQSLNNHPFNELTKIAARHAVNSGNKSFATAVQIAKKVDPTLAGTIILSGKGLNDEFIKDCEYLTVNGHAPPHIQALTHQENSEMQQSVVQHKKQVLKRLSKLIANNVLSGGEGSSEILAMIEYELGLTPDQLDTLKDIKDSDGSIDKKEKAIKLLKAIMFFNLANMDPNQSYTAEQKKPLADSTFLNDVIFEDIDRQ